MIDVNLRNKAMEMVEEYSGIALSDPYYPSYHIAPPVGLLNDPNGFIQWKGTYHLFYQWMPFHTGHGAKFWAHLTSRDLVDWAWQEPALAPDEWYDRTGCYSGSAVEKDDELLLFYTGNVKDDDGNRETYQCKARSEDGVSFEKVGVQIELPDGFTPHFRDPKVWKMRNEWYMVIGAQTEEKEGCIVLYRSEDLDSWTYEGILASGMGYMWECPDFFRLKDDVLLFSPQGLEEKGIDYRNMYQSGYIIGDFDKGFPEEKFRELDHGFEFYAPQTTEDDQGRRLLVGWMGMPDGGEEYFPTHDNHWIHQMTLPRELLQQGDRVIQKPVEELEKLRTDKLVEENSGSFAGNLPRNIELIMREIEEDIYIDLYDYFSIRLEGRRITIERPAMDGSGKEWRAADLVSPLTEMRMFIDQSSLEIFVNDGEIVFSSRMFPDVDTHECRVKGRSSITAWNLRAEKGAE
ncbi:beta-fructofuranosidase [Salimicrobium halophilum]|uniref:Sucrose-6-phosphate hydrolase n=2 Tax=Salimicrobium halophilum TaxID=86666 RepID=A0A1G8S3A6_9BACI|nr:sucrose-6-phosphate hydrolase [Salimicrobium halophilum]SDJ23699.1 beta-fructofuranosidase [Salimicrobium halophilum]